MHAMSYGHFRPRHHLIFTAGYHRIRAKAFRIWREAACFHRAAWDHTLAMDLAHSHSRAG